MSRAAVHKDDCVPEGSRYSALQYIYRSAAGVATRDRACRSSQSQHTQQGQSMSKSSRLSEISNVHLLARAASSVSAAERVLQLAGVHVARLAEIDKGLNAEQHAAHGLSWLATYVEALRQLSGWAGRLDAEGQLGEIERLILHIGVTEYAAQIAGGIAMSQGETIRLSELGLARADIREYEDRLDLDEVSKELAADRARLAELIAANPAATTFGNTGLDDVHAAMQEEMRRFCEAEVLPHAHEWHLENNYIP
ncbi:MAG TPA: hypothetical protein VMX97_07145, partial [Hyphomicrobiaceae bacterium]|nr:hypothetical protein [Hyphomicrobiaceae bacterium]